MIVAVERARQYIPEGSTVVCVGGGFDPLHADHVRYIEAAAEEADYLVAIVNGDGFLRRKKGRALMPQDQRAEIIDALKWVDLTTVWDDGTQTIDGALRLIHPDVLAKSGDRRDASTIPEWQTCQALGIKIVIVDAQWRGIHSSDLLKEWERVAT